MILQVLHIPPDPRLKDYVPQFELGKAYRMQNGELITITKVNRDSPSHACVEGSDEIWRYDRPDDAGRCTASAFDMSDPRNLVPGVVDG